MLTPPLNSNSQNSIISFGYVDFYAKIFLILYTRFENSTTRTAIMGVVAGGRLADQLILSQPEGQIITTQYYVPPWIFRLATPLYCDLAWPCLTFIDCHWDERLVLITPIHVSTYLIYFYHKFNIDP